MPVFLLPELEDLIPEWRDGLLFEDDPVEAQALVETNKILLILQVHSQRLDFISLHGGVESFGVALPLEQLDELRQLAVGLFWHLNLIAEIIMVNMRFGPHYILSNHRQIN